MLSGTWVCVLWCARVDGCRRNTLHETVACQQQPAVAMHALVVFGARGREHATARRLTTAAAVRNAAAPQCSRPAGGLTSGSGMTYGRRKWSPMARLIASRPMMRWLPPFSTTLPPRPHTRAWAHASKRNATQAGGRAGRRVSMRCMWPRRVSISAGGCCCQAGTNSCSRVTHQLVAPVWLVVVCQLHSGALAAQHRARVTCSAAVAAAGAVNGGASCTHITMRCCTAASRPPSTPSSTRTH